MNRIRFHRVLAAWLILVCLGASAWSQTPVTEVRIISRDATRIDESLVRGFISIQVGEEITRDALSRDIRVMERSGRFSFVSADLEQTSDGVAVVYTVELKPRIRRLVVDGAQYLTNRKVRELLDIGAGDPVDDALLATKAQAVKDHYRKKYFPFADLSWTIKVDPETRLADVNVTVKEGRRAKVKKIRFTGNDHVSSRELRKGMKQRQRNIFSWITGSGTYNPDDLAGDLPVIRRAFLNQGLLDVKIGEPQVRDVGNDRIEIIIPVEEGRQYRLGDISIQGVTIFELDHVRRAITNRPGDLASADALQGMTRAVKDFYGSRGYIETSVNYQLDPYAAPTASATNPVVDIKFTVREGHLAYVRHIRFRGVTKTKDKVMRREVTLYPGEVMNEVKLRNSENRLRNLGYFSSVVAAPEATPDPSKYDAVFDLQEQKTGQFMVGAGFSSIDNLIGFIELQEGNFDITQWPPTGGGQKLRLRGTIGTKRSDVELNLTEPWFLDRRLSLGGTLFRRDSKYFSDEYDQLNTGGNITLGWPAARFTRVNFIYGLEEISVYNVEDTASDRIKEEEGDRLKSSFTTEIIFDTRDNAFIPTRGMRAMVSGMVAGGPLQGETDIYRVDLMASKFFPLWYDHVFNLRGWIAGVDFYGDSERVPIFDRLFLGGARTLRGFDFRDVGPKDDQGEPLGGRSMWYATAEYTIPVVRSVRVAAFYDIGMVYEKAFDYEWSEYNSDFGFGVRFDIPGFPLRFDYAWPLKADEFNDRDSGRFQFSIGYSY